MLTVALILTALRPTISDAQIDAMARTLAAIAVVESGGDPNAWNEAEQAAGILQIRPIMVEDVNRILGEGRYSLADRWDMRSSCAMFAVYSLHYWPDGTPEQWARAWCAGPKGPSKASSLPYWKKVKHEMEKQRAE